VADLRAGVTDANGQLDQLIWGTTVLNNGQSNTLSGEPTGVAEPGGNERDWFFASLTGTNQDALPDRKANELVD
jgi:hypothetical protein